MAFSLSLWPHYGLARTDFNDQMDRDTEVYHYITKIYAANHTFNISPTAGRNATTITQIVVFMKAEKQKNAKNVECKICGKISAAD